MRLSITFFLLIFSLSGCAGSGTTNHVNEKALQSFYALDYEDESSSVLFHIARGPNVGIIDISVNGKSVGHLNQEENLLSAIIVKPGIYNVSLSAKNKVRALTIKVTPSSKFLVDIKSRNFLNEPLTLIALKPSLIRGAKLYQISDLR